MYGDRGENSSLGISCNPGNQIANVGDHGQNSEPHLGKYVSVASERSLDPNPDGKERRETINFGGFDVCMMTPLLYIACASKIKPATSSPKQTGCMGAALRFLFLAQSWCWMTFSCKA